MQLALLGVVSLHEMLKDDFQHMECVFVYRFLFHHRWMFHHPTLFSNSFLDNKSCRSLFEHFMADKLVVCCSFDKFRVEMIKSGRVLRFPVFLFQHRPDAGASFLLAFFLYRGGGV